MIDPPKAKDLTNGHTDASPDDADAKENRSDGENATVDTRRDRLVQCMFDFLYLQCVFATGGGGKAGKLDRLTEAMKERAELDATAQERLRKSANDYWKRTYLLFGLLAVGHTL